MKQSLRYLSGDHHNTPCCNALFVPDATNPAKVRCRNCWREYDASYPIQLSKERVSMGQYRGLRGNGFIVLDAGNYDLIEHEELEEAQGDAARRANQTGCAIVYAPVAVIRPKMAEVSMDVPRVMKGLMGKLGLGPSLPSGDSGAVKSGPYPSTENGE